MYFSRCFNGDKFIYSFFYEEDIFITSIDHNIVERVNVKSNYIDRVVMPNDYNGTLKSMCENQIMVTYYMINTVMCIIEFAI